MVSTRRLLGGLPQNDTSLSNSYLHTLAQQSRLLLVMVCGQCSRVIALTRGVVRTSHMYLFMVYILYPQNEQKKGTTGNLTVPGTQPSLPPPTYSID